MQTLERIHGQIQNFFYRNVTDKIFARGKRYFNNGQVVDGPTILAGNRLVFSVIGSEVYRVQIDLDPEDEELVVDYFCDCPYHYQGACKHVVGAVFWIGMYWDSIRDKLGSAASGSQLVTSSESFEKPKQDYLEIENFIDLDKRTLDIRYRRPPWNHEQLKRIEVFRKSLGHFNVHLDFGPSYPDGISEQKVLDVESDNKNLKVSCSCGETGSNFCFHAYVFFEAVLRENRMSIFVEPDRKDLALLGKEKLRQYGLSADVDWEDYFEPGFVANTLTLVPKENVANLISPLEWNLDGPESIFEGNPIEELGVDQYRDKKSSYEMGFFFGFSGYDDNFYFEPLIARESKKGEPMSIGFKHRYAARYPDHISKRSSDIPLIALCNTMEEDVSTLDVDEKLSLLNRYSDAIADHPYIYLCDPCHGQNLRKGDLTKIRFHSKPPRLKYILTEKAGFITIRVHCRVLGHDLPINGDAPEMLHPHFMKVNDHLFFIPDGRDARHMASAQTLDGKMISASMLPELFEKYLGHALRKSDVEFKNLETYKMRTQTLTPVSKEIYLSEVGNFVLFRPFIRYENDYLLDALSQEYQWEVDDTDLVKTEQDIELAAEFRAELCDLFPEFKTQFNRTDYLHIGYKELLKDNLFLDLFGEFEKKEYKVFGVRDLTGLKVSPYPGKVIYSVSSGIDWFEVDAKMVFGDIEISIDQLKKRFKPGSDYIELGNGTRGIIPREWLKKLEKLFQHGELKGDKFLVSNKKFTIVDELFDELEEGVTEMIHEKKAKLLNFDKIQKHPLPKGIKGTLRHYQEDGFQWLCFLDEFQWGGILADDMGLGKTLQIITFIKHILGKNKQTNLIVVPTSLLFNWENEIEKFAPSLKVHFYYGSQRIKSTDDFADYDIVFTSYGHMLSDIELLRNYAFNYVILDESQAIKNPASKRFKAARLLKANNRLAMTGTPIENNTFDLYAQMAFLNPGFLGSAKSFKADFAKAIDTNRDEIKAAELQRLIKPFVLRRTKKQVATELPDKTEEVLYCEMDKAQQKVYDAFRNEYRQRLIEKIDEEGMNKARFAVLEGLTKLRQICDTPEILPGEEKYVGKSVKVDLLMMHIKEKTANHKILIFSQFVKMLRVIENRIKEEGIPYEYLDGQSTTTQRQASVEHFQEDESCRVFLISLKAGGTGLNLMAADYVYIVDPWWNPAVENQAIDRCYRIGQDKKVIAYRMICKNTVEEKIMELQKKKKSIAGDIVTTDEGVLKKLKKEDLIGLFG